MPPISRLTVAFGAALIAVAALAETPTPPTTLPTLLIGRGADLAEARQRYRAGDPRIAPVAEDVIRGAERALTQPITAVTDKDAAHLPPSGDAHDYASLSPYRWPNPDTDDGLPYVRKDGQINPDRALYDQPRMDALYKAVRPLAIAYYLTGDERFAENAARRLRTWFLDPATRMNPHLTYAQFIPGEDELNHWGIIETGRLLWTPDASTLLLASDHWSEADDTALRDWFGDYVDWLTTSDLGKQELAARNNHGTWCRVQVVTFAQYAGRDAVAREYLEQIPQRIAWQVEPDGKQPLELERTQALHYSDFNLRGLLLLARLGEPMGVDLYGFKTEDGRSIRAALDFLLPYLIDPASFPYEQIKGPKPDNYQQTLRMAAIGFDDPRYERAISQLPADAQTGWFDLMMAPPAAPHAQD